MTGLSDEELVAEVLENPYMQAFCGFREFVTGDIIANRIVSFHRPYVRLIKCGKQGKDEPEDSSEESIRNRRNGRTLE